MKRGNRDMKKSLKNVIIIMVSVILILILGGVSAISISKSVKQQKNESDIVGVWKNDGVEMISFDAEGKVIISRAFPLEKTGLIEGEAQYVFSEPDVIRVDQEIGNNLSIEFGVDTEDNCLILYLCGEEFLVLYK